MTAIGIRFQQLSLAALAPLVVAVFWSGANDPVNIPKATLAACVALLVVVVSVIRIAATRRLVVPKAPATWAALAFAVAVLLATLTSDLPGYSIAGTVGRNGGLLLYGACTALFLVGIRVLDGESAGWLAWGVLVGGIFATLYGLLQQFDLDPVNWADIGLSPIIGAFGNPDFESAYLGIVVPVAAWGALSHGWASGWRIASGMLALAAFGVAVLTSAIQGPIAAASGVVVLAVAVLLNRGDAWMRRGLGVLAASASLMALGVVAGLAGIGLGERLTNASSLEARRWYWSSAWSMFKDQPMTGVGLDRYGAYYREFRPAAAAEVSNYSDAAHSVPLHLLATGGILLALAYVAVVGAVLWALVQGLRRTAGEERLLLGGLGGAWVAYQAQSLVSIDQPALAVTHWLLAAGVIAVGAPPRLWERLLPGAVLPRVRKGRAPEVAEPPPTVWSGATVAVVTAAVLIGLTAFWMALKPLRASHDTRAASEALARGDGNAALAEHDDATGLASYEGSYWLRRGKFLEQVKQPPLAAQSYAAGIQHDPRSYDLLVAAARLAKAQGDADALERYSRQLARLDISGRWRAAVDS